MIKILVKPRELTSLERESIPGASKRTHVLCLDPQTGLALTGQAKRVPKNTYWMKRLRQGDVVQVKPAKPKEPTKRSSGGRTTKGKPDSEA